MIYINYIENMDVLRSKLIKFREKNKISIREMAKKLGVSFQSYQYYESGRNDPPARLLPKLANLLNCPIDALFFNIPYDQRLPKESPITAKEASRILIQAIDSNDKNDTEITITTRDIVKILKKKF